MAAIRLIMYVDVRPIIDMMLPCTSIYRVINILRYRLFQNQILIISLNIFSIFDTFTLIIKIIEYKYE